MSLQPLHSIRKIRAIALLRLLLQSYRRKIFAGESDNYILPFFWMRDQSEEVLRTEIEKIYDCGIRVVCLESRPHPDFGGLGWWHDFDMFLCPEFLNESSNRNISMRRPKCL